MRSKAGTNGDDAKLEIDMSGHEIKNIKNVAVKQFTINKSSFNITSHKDTLKWAIVRKKADGTVDYKAFTIKIPNGYYQSKDLIGTSTEGPSSVICALILAIEDKEVMSETSAFSLVLKQDPDTFRVNLQATVGSNNNGDFWFVPLKRRNDSNDGLWLDLASDLWLQGIAPRPLSCSSASRHSCGFVPDTAQVITLSCVIFSGNHARHQAWLCVCP